MRPRAIRLLVAVLVAALPSPVTAAGASSPAIGGAAGSRTVVVERKELIESVSIDPERPCRGQGVRVIVSLKPEARDAKVAIAGRAGSAAVLHFDRRGRRRIGIVARDWGSGMQIEKRVVRVRDCQSEEARIEVQPIADTRVALRWTGAPQDGAGSGYRWDLGDGSVVTTQEPFLVHDYALASQPRATASWIVEAQPPGGGPAARAAVAIANPWWLASRGSVHWLRARSQPFARRGAGDDAADLLSMEVAGDAIVPRLDRVSVRGFACSDLDRVLTAELPVSTLSRDDLRREGWTAVEVAVPRSVWAEPVCRIEARLHGRTVRGKPAIAMAAAEIAPANARRRVAEPALLDRLREARTRFGRGRISEADLRMLAAERGASPNRR
ncbi:MAG TPA: PKD domain-containing protein [Candidatus Binatia bacterium]|nr:PKD domain-containing protein [Candidatus Binatia bacterium]